MVKKREREKREKLQRVLNANYQFKTFFLVPISLKKKNPNISREFLKHGIVLSHRAVNDFQKHLSSFEVCVQQKKSVTDWSLMQK